MAMCAPENPHWQENYRSHILLYNRAVTEPADGAPSCGICGNKRSIAFDKEGYFTLRDCQCLALVKQKDRIRESGMENLLKQCAFDNFRQDTPWQKQLLHKVRQAASSDKWLLLCGQSGCGKTHLASAVCREAILRNCRVKYMHWPVQVKALCAGDFDYDLRQRLLRPFLEAQVLLLDDLFQARRDKDGIPIISRQEQNLAFELLSSRAQEHKRTLITTEVQPGALRQLGNGLFGRIAQQAGDYILSVPYGKEYDQRLRLGH